MVLNLQDLSKEDALYLSLRDIYQRAGYEYSAFNKFEEYQLYRENMAFIPTKGIITFNGIDGRLMALKPDITLSVLKGYAGLPHGEQRLYYRENVFRLDKRESEYRELTQVGVECVGGGGLYPTLEIISLAAKSLAEINPSYALCVSHMGVLRFAVDSLGGGEEDEKRLSFLISAKNTHGLMELARKNNIPAERASAFTRIVSSTRKLGEAVNDLKRLSPKEAAGEGVSELEEIADAIKGTEYEKNVMLDISVTNDFSYYNGVIMRGYVKGHPAPLLGGGRYDFLAERFGVAGGAAGFAIDFSEVTAFYGGAAKKGFDALIVYGDGDDIAEVFASAEKLREAGKRTLVSKGFPKGEPREYGEIICFPKGGEAC